MEQISKYIKQLEVKITDLNVLISSLEKRVKENEVKHEIFRLRLDNLQMLIEDDYESFEEDSFEDVEPVSKKQKK